MIEKFQQALELDPSLDLNPEAEARSQAAATLVNKGRELVKEGKVEELIAAYAEAQEFDPDMEISAWEWNDLGWFCNLQGHDADQKIYQITACVSATARSTRYPPLGN